MVLGKGAAMGAANVIPGVSGGTVAFLTGIYERLIRALKSVDLAAIGLLRRGDLRGFAKHIDLFFLVPLGVGAVLSILTLARVLKWAFAQHETLVWAFFFGLIAASVPSVARKVKRWSPLAIGALVVGTAIAFSMAFLGRAEENDGFVYLMLCGVVSICSMITPGLSGSFVLLLLGNYELVMIDAVNWIRTEPMSAVRILTPVLLGAGAGVVVLSRFLTWLFRVYHDVAVALIAGFVAGSLAVIWPWKETVVETFVKADGEVKEKVTGFENWHLPDWGAGATWIAVSLMVAGGVLVTWMERAAETPEESA